MTAPSQTPGAATGRALHLALAVAPAMLALGALLYAVREVLSPIVLLALLCLVLWPERRQPFVARLLFAAVALTVLWVLSVTGSLLAPFVLGLAIAYLLAPAVAWLVRHRVPRILAVILTLLPFLLGLVLLVVLLVPAVERQLVDLAARLPGLLEQFVQWVVALRTRFLASGHSFLTDEQVAWLRNVQVSDLAAMVQRQWSSVGDAAQAAFLGLGKGLLTVVILVLYGVATPVVTFYLLASWEKFTGGLAHLVPPAQRDRVFAFLHEYDKLLGRYVRGALTEAVLMAALVGGGLALLGFPGALLVGVITGFGNLVPYVGLVLAIIPGVLLALVSGAVVPSLLKLAAIFVVEQLMDGSILGPRIVGGAVGLNPVWVMIAIAFFSALLGFVGLLLAVPLALLVRMVVERAIVRYRTSAYFTAADGQPPAEAR
ncbi:MAG: AI-2E family transporter [Gemmatimonadales bacterium]